jgi:hypothetical protein
MKPIFQQWLAERTQTMGVLACGIRCPDNTALTQSWSKEYTHEALENAWRCVSDTFQVLKINFFPNEQIRWVYENAFLYCGRRNDGICLAIFTSRDPQVFDQETIERLIVEFRALGHEPPK